MTLARRLWRHRSRGFALFELVCAIALIGALIVGAVLLFQAQQKSARQSATVQLVHDLRGGAARAFSGYASYSGLTMSMLKARGAVPESAIDGSSYRHPYDGDVNVWPLDKFFMVGLEGLDDEACQNAAGSWVGRTRKRSGILQVAAAAGTFGAPDKDTTTDMMKAASGMTDFDGANAPFSISDIAGMCDEGDGENNLFLLFD